LIRVHNEHVRFWVIGWPTPFPTTIESRKNNRAFFTRWYELTIAADFGEPCQSFRMRLGCTLRDHVSSKFLPGERLRQSWERLGFRSNFAGDIRRRHFAVFDREQGLASLAVK